MNDDKYSILRLRSSALEKWSQWISECRKKPDMLKEFKEDYAVRKQVSEMLTGNDIQ